MCSKMSKIVSLDHQLVQETKFDAEDTKYPYSRATFDLNFVRSLPNNTLEYKHQRVPRRNCGFWVTEPVLWITWFRRNHILVTCEVVGL